MRKKDLDSHCDEVSGKLMPIVNFNSCAAKRDCVEVCPFDVFEMRPITKEDKAQLSLKGKIKTFFLATKPTLIIQKPVMLVVYVFLPVPKVRLN